MRFGRAPRRRGAAIAGAGLALAIAAACSDGAPAAGAGSGGASGAGGGGATDAAAGTAGAAGISGGAGAAGAAGGGTGGSGGGLLEASSDSPPCTPSTPTSGCDLVAGCGCELGEKCDLFDPAAGSAQCTEDGTLSPFQGCVFGSCVAGTICVLGVCRPVCASSAGCVAPSATCVPAQYASGGTAVPVPGVSVCTSGCDPVAPSDGCGAALTCSFRDGAPGVTDCFAAGTGVGPGTCAAQGCAPGFQCVDVQGSLDCLRWCRVGQPADCDGKTCVRLTTAPTLGGVEYGTCEP
ncbi:MAG: hypothetical protein IT376_00245 [Polyangiaceae bacterium]|nr:hypothetical protein [Polyangiaceae bacterium]